MEKLKFSDLSLDTKINLCTLGVVLLLLGWLVGSSHDGPDFQMSGDRILDTHEGTVYTRTASGVVWEKLNGEKGYHRYSQDHGPWEKYQR